MLGPIRVYLRRLLCRDRFERELTEELRFHLETRIEDLERQGLNPGNARRRARLEFGGMEQYQEQLRAERPGAGLDELVQDIRLSMRRMRRESTFAFVVMLTLALGIGASTAVFGVVSTTLLSRIPYDAPDRLVIGRTTRDGVGTGFVSGLDYFDYREASRSFDFLAAFYAFPQSLVVTGVEEPWVADAGYVTWNLFRTLGADPIVGRHFLPEEEARADARVAIISFGLWQNRFGGSDDTLGQTLILDGTPHTVIGVLPRGFRFNWNADIWRVAARPGEMRDRHNYHLVGRLKPDVSIMQAQLDIDAISRSLERAYPESNKGKGLRLVTLQEYLGGEVRTGLLLPSAATGCLLLIACANVAGLLLARGQRRLSEFAMRSALGASRWRLVRQQLTESVLLTVPASLLGIVVAYLFQHLLLHFLPVDRLGITQPVIDGQVLLFAFLTSVATGLLVGVVPAIRGAGVSLSPHLGTGRQLCEGDRSARLRSGLVVVQIATSIVLLVGSGLLAHSLFRLSAVDLGFSSDQVVTARIRIQAPSYQERAGRQAFFASTLEEISGLPGIRSAGAVSNLPILDPGNIFRSRAADHVLATGEYGERTLIRRISPGYFATMNTPLLRGRNISASDRDGAPAVTVLSESLARRLFPDRNPLGQTVVMIDSLRSSEVPFEVVGIVRDARLSNPRVSSDPAMYLSYLQANPLSMRIVIRSSGDSASLAGPIREILRRKDRNALLTEVATMDQIVDEAYSDFRMVVQYLSLFACIALLLAAVGLYGTLAYHVSRQEHEIGVRLAMGATSVSVLLLVLRRGMWLVATGLLLGIAAAYPGTRLVQNLLFETIPIDPAAYVSAVLLLVMVAAFACLKPAMSATRVDPVQVMRSE